MANRRMYQYLYSLERERKFISARVTIGATGAPTLDAVNSKGVLSVTRVSAGKYTFVFGVTQNGANVLDTYRKLLAVDTVFDTSGAGAGVAGAPVLGGITSNQVAVAGTCSLTLQFVNGALAATDPANGEVLMANFEFGDGSGT